MVKALLVWTPKESIREHLPEIFLKSDYGKCVVGHVIIDCAEIFIERPKSLSVQAATWLDYKYHNTFKFLVRITPTGLISFLSFCYGGRASDKYITRDNGFYDLLERDDEVKADRGFQIQEDLLLHFCRLVVSSRARVKSQMKTSEVKNTKEFFQVKFLWILKGTIPVAMIQHVDNII